MMITKSGSRNVVFEFLSNFTSECTRAAYRSDLESFFKYYNSSFSEVSQISLSHLISYREYLLVKFSSNSVNRKLSGLKSFFIWCNQQGIIQTNPASALKIPKSNPEHPTQAFTDKETLDILKLPDVSSFRGLMHELVLELLFKLGLRRSEVAGIRVGDIFQERDTTVIRIKGKGDKIRIVPISSNFVEKINKFLDKCERPTSSSHLISNGNGKRIDTSTIYRIVKSYAKMAGINKRVSPHSCRATVISHLLEQSVSPRDVADFVGHSNIQTTAIYDKKRLGLKNSAAFKVNYNLGEVT